MMRIEVSSKRTPAVKSAVVLLPAVFLAGCATVSVPARLRSQDDFRPSARTSQAYELPDSAGMEPRAWGLLATDSLVLYRPISEAGGATTYHRRVREVGSSGVEISGYTLANGRHVRFDGSVERRGDQLEFERRWRSMEKVDTTRVVHSVAEVQSIDVQVPSAGRTTLVWGAILIMTAAGLALGLAGAMNESTM